MVNVGDICQPTAFTQKPHAYIAGSSGKINKLLVGLWCHPVNHCCFPKPVNPAAHQVIHKVIAAGNRIKNSTYKPCLITTLDSAKAKIYAILDFVFAAIFWLAAALWSALSEAGSFMIEALNISRKCKEVNNITLFISAESKIQNDVHHFIKYHS